MEPLGYSILVLLLSLAAAWAGFLMHRHAMPESGGELTLLAGGSALGVASTLTAVVLGIITASAATDFEQANQAVTSVAADTLAVDNILKTYGPETAPIREKSRAALQHWADRLQSPRYYSDATTTSADPGRNDEAEAVYVAVANLKPSTDAQRELRERALNIIGSSDLSEERTRFIVRPGDLPPAFLVMIGAWMVLEFFCFGLSSPRGTAAYLLIAIGAIVVASSLFLILELKDPTSGIVRVSVEPLNRVGTLLSN